MTHNTEECCCVDCCFKREQTKKIEFIDKLCANIKPERITISKKLYESLLKDRKTLRALEAAGVDNWEGYSEAFPSEDEEFEDED